MIDRKAQNVLRDIMGFRVGLALPAVSTDVADQPAEQMSVIIFTIGKDVKAVDVESTEGVVDCPSISPVPDAPTGVVGVTSIRGRITLVVDLSFGSGPPAPKRRLILLRGDAQLGILADRIEGVVGLEPQNIKHRDERRGDDRAGSRGRAVANAYFARDGLMVPIIDVDSVSEL